MSQVISERRIKHWLFRVGNGVNFNHSVKLGIWSLNTTNTSGGKKFFENATAGDILWFVTSDSNGHLVACGTFTEVVKRRMIPLIAPTQTNEELGWTDTTQNSSLSNYEVHFKDTYYLQDCDLRSRITHRNSVVVYDSEIESNSKLDLPEEYATIVKYSPARMI